MTMGVATMTVASTMVMVVAAMVGKGASYGGRGDPRHAPPLRSALRALQMSKKDDDDGVGDGDGGGGDGGKGASYGGRGDSRHATPLRSALRALQVSKKERQVHRLAKTYQRHISGTSATRQRLISGSSAAMFSRRSSLAPLG